MTDELLSERRPGASLDYLVSIAEDAPDAPTDLAALHDHYYGGGYAEHAKGERAGAG